MFPRVKVVVGPVQEQKVDALVVNVFEDALPKRGGKATLGGATGALDKATRGAITEHLARGDHKGHLGEVAVLYPARVPASRVLLVGLGKQKEFTLDRARIAAAKAARRAKELGAATLATVAHGASVGGLEPEEACEATLEGTLLALWSFDRYRGTGTKEPEKHVREVRLVEADAAKARAFKAAAQATTVLCESVWMTRDLQTLSGADATATRMGERAKELAKETGLHVQVLGKEEIRRLGMGGLLGVNQGSFEPPRFVVLEHNRGKKDLPTVVVVGKGITFDSGGISIKPAEKMDEMKFDKSGACAVYGILRTVALLDVPVHVVGLAAWTDNLPSGSAVKPGDILTAMNGVTIEVVNTDAEGRLILADALAYADRYEPDAVLDMATLTGAIQIALGAHATGLMGTDEGLLRRIEEAGERTHERVWRMPFYDEYDEQIKSKVADVKNSGGRPAGAITAGRFLKKFVGEWPWAHLDIAATAWGEGGPSFNAAYSPGQATGVGVRLVVRMLRDWK